MQPAASGPGYGDLVLTSLLVLAVVCVLAWLAVKLLGRWMEGRRVGGGVSVVARVPLEPRRALYVIEAGGRTLLVGSSEGGITMLTELDAAALEATRARPRPTFAGQLGLALAQLAGRRAPPRARNAGAQVAAAASNETGAIVDATEAS